MCHRIISAVSSAVQLFRPFLLNGSCHVEGIVRWPLSPNPSFCGVQNSLIRHSVDWWIWVFFTDIFTWPSTQSFHIKEVVSIIRPSMQNVHIKHTISIKAFHTKLPRHDEASVMSFHTSFRINIHYPSRLSIHSPPMKMDLHQPSHSSLTISITDRLYNSLSNDVIIHIFKCNGRCRAIYSLSKIYVHRGVPYENTINSNQALSVTDFRIQV